MRGAGDLVKAGVLGAKGVVMLRNEGLIGIFRPKPEKEERHRGRKENSGGGGGAHIEKRHVLQVGDCVAVG